MRPANSLSRFLFAALLFHLQPTSLQAISDAARRIETTFNFVIASQPFNNQSLQECPATIRHSVIDHYKGINPANISEAFDGIIWKHLVVDGVACLDSPEREAATFFEHRIPSPPDTPAERAVPWFLFGIDNSARRCGTFAPTYPARYFFTDDMPRFKQRFIDTHIIPTAAELPDSLANPLRGDVFMLTQQFQPPADSDVVSPIVCIYQAATPAPTPEPTLSPKDDDGGSVCFPAHATVRDQRGHHVPMHRLRLGHLIQVTASGIMSPVVAFSHRDGNILSPVTTVQISTGLSTGLSNFTTFSATSSHLLRLPDGSLSQVGKLRRGDSVLLSGKRIGRVEQVMFELQMGLYSPITAHGDVVVDGVVASCYTTSVRAQAAHAFLAPVRALFAAAVGAGISGPEWCGVIDLLRWALR